MVLRCLCRVTSQARPAAEMQCELSSQWLRKILSTGDAKTCLNLQIQVQALCAMLALFYLSAGPIYLAESVVLWVPGCGPRLAHAKAKSP